MSSRRYWISFLPFSLLTFSVFGLFVFFSTTIFYMATVVNYTNCVEYNEYITGERNEALISTLRPFVAKLSDATKYGIQILVLVLSGVYLLSQNISGIETSFVLYPQDTQTIISARSIGEANVQVILEPLGGGGHAATAGAQVKNKNVAATLDELLKSIDKFFEP